MSSEFKPERERERFNILLFKSKKVHVNNDGTSTSKDEFLREHLKFVLY